MPNHLVIPDRRPLLPTPGRRPDRIAFVITSLPPMYPSSFKSPAATDTANVRDERRVGQMGKGLAIGISLSHQTIPDIDLQVLAVRTDHRDIEALVAIAARPVERRFQHDLFFRIALRTVETRSGLGNAKDVTDAVITNTITGTEVRVGVVVESAPANATRIDFIGSQLIVNARVAHRVFRNPLDIVVALVGTCDQ